MFDEKAPDTCVTTTDQAKCKGVGVAAGLDAKLSALADMDATQLRAEWRRLYRAHPPKRVSRGLLKLGVAWKLQERACGGLSATLKRRLAELAKTMDERGDLAQSRAVKLKPGTKLVREWGGRTHDVLVVEDGFEWQGHRWRSLSAIAREITGARWSGPRFFGLTKKALSVKAPQSDTGVDPGARERAP